MCILKETHFTKKYSVPKKSAYIDLMHVLLILITKKEEIQMLLFFSAVKITSRLLQAV